MMRSSSVYDIWWWCPLLDMTSDDEVIFCIWHLMTEGGSRCVYIYWQGWILKGARGRLLQALVVTLYRTALLDVSSSHCERQNMMLTLLILHKSWHLCKPQLWWVTNNYWVLLLQVSFRFSCLLYFSLCVYQWKCVAHISLKSVQCACLLNMVLYPKCLRVVGC
jgi:hypothetical protein